MPVWRSIELLVLDKILQKATKALTVRPNVLRRPSTRTTGETIRLIDGRHRDAPRAIDSSPIGHIFAIPRCLLFESVDTRDVDVDESEDFDRMPVSGAEMKLCNNQI